jgi:ABC-type cobalamin/Fe3+-siderophores transport system ATPase subunit
MSFTVKAFDLEFPTNGGVSIGLIGASRSGKTTLMKYLYKTHFKKHITVMCTMNAHAAIYEDLDSKVIVSSHYHTEILREFHELNSACDNRYPFLFISDDYVEPKIKNDQEVTRALTIYRNANVSSIWSFQGRTLMSSVGRNNLNYIAVLKQQTPKEWENIIKEFLSMWLPTGMTMREMIDFCRKATEDHQFFLVDQIKGECYLTKLSRAQADV